MSAQGNLTAAIVAAARHRAAARGQRVVDDLLASAPDQLVFLHELAEFCSMEPISIAEMLLAQPLFDCISFPEALRRQCLVLDNRGQLVVVLSDPFDLEQQTWAAARCGAEPKWHIALPADITAFLAMHEENLRALEHASVLDTIQKKADQSDELDFTSIHDEGSRVVKFVHSTIYDAMKAGASDIHLETSNEGLTVKYRLDGVLVRVASAAGTEFADQVISRIKVMSDLDIAERRIPQDGRFRFRYQRREIDYRVSVMPSMLGEDAVIRILDKSSLADEVAGLSLERLGFDASSLHRIRHLIRRPYGMFLVTGPTGSGKTTTMYAALTELNDGRDKIVTIEDPVEYQLSGVLQIPVNERKGLTFARGLRSILRHDPDKILVGEIRDPETAQIAVQSALTGHLVFTSVHANNVFDVLGRFLHMGVDTYSFVAAMNGILAQRLLRRVCEECAAPYIPGAADVEQCELAAERLRYATFRRGLGCGHCRGTGFKGRYAVGEVLVLTDELRELISNRAPITELKQAARRAGTRFLHESALDLALAGSTTLEEVNRVTFAS